MEKLNSYWQDYCSGCIQYNYLKRKLKSIDERKKRGEKLSVSYSDELETNGTQIHMEVMPYGQVGPPFSNPPFDDYSPHDLVYNRRNFPLIGTRIYKLCNHGGEYYIHINPLYKKKLKECIKDYEHLIEKD